MNVIILSTYILLLESVSTYPIVINDKLYNETIIELLQENSSLPINSNDTTVVESEKQNTLYFDFRSLIQKRTNDWRDAWEEPQIIWSIESRNHPDYGRSAGGLLGVDGDRSFRSSRFMSFAILGSVIGFILYTYGSHVLMMRRLRQEEDKQQLHELIKRSALIMASSLTTPGTEMLTERSGRRRSLINMFRGFKL